MPLDSIRDRFPTESEVDLGGKSARQYMDSYDTRNIAHGSPYDQKDLGKVGQGLSDAYMSSIMELPMMAMEYLMPDDPYEAGVLQSGPQDRMREGEFKWQEHMESQAQNPSYATGQDFGQALGVIADPFIDGPLLGVPALGKLLKTERGTKSMQPFNAMSDLFRNERGAVGDVVYHGTDQDIKTFDPARFGSATGANSAKQGVWVVSEPGTAHGYADFAAFNRPIADKLKLADEAEKAGDWDKYDDYLREAEELESTISGQRRRGQNIMPLKYEGDYHTIDMAGAEFMEKQNEINRIISKAKREGKDGVIFQNLSDDAGFSNRPAEHTVVFDPKNIKSLFE